MKRVCADLGLLAIRLMVGWVFIFHGAQKLFGWFGGFGLEATAGFFAEKLHLPMPYASAVAAASTEFFGGILLAIGLLTRLVCVPLFVTMMVASFVAHAGKFGLPEGMEYALTLGVVVFGLALIGPGRLSFDGLLFPEHQNPKPPTA
jgi:putative oxidoreductase